jgi:hypothetical protein
MNSIIKWNGHRGDSNGLKFNIMKKLNRNGEMYTTKQGCRIEIVDYIGVHNYLIRFIDYNLVIKSSMNHIKKGSVLNPLYKSIFGIGFLGVGEKFCKKKKGLWKGMFGRCYSEKTRKRYPTYKGCTVAEEWHNFQNFAKWYEENWKPWMDNTWHLDKDILVKGSKVYSPETCCFVPQEINVLFTKHNTNNNCPQGVRKSGNKFTSRFNQIHLGTFNTPEEAFQAYKTAKEKYIKEVADKWRGKITEQTYEVLINYKIEITD